MTKKKSRRAKHDYHAPDLHLHLADPRYPFKIDFPDFYGRKAKAGVMRGAQELRRQGWSMSEALKEGWASLARARVSAGRERKTIDLPSTQWAMHDPRRDPWRMAQRGMGRLLALWNPRATGPSDKAIIEASIQVPRNVYEQLKASGEFDVLPGDVLARRGRNKKATNIFIIARGRRRAIFDLGSLAVGLSGATGAIALAAVGYLVRIEHRLSVLETKINYLVPDEKMATK